MNTRKEFREHSQLKVKLYESYLRRYLLILGQVKHVKKIAIYEPFAGPGKHDNGEDGSPLVAWKIINETKCHSSIQKSNPNIQLELWLNDENKDYTDELKGLLNPPEKHNIHIHNWTANEFCERLLHAPTNGDTHKLWFIDPFGYTQIDYSVIDNLLSQPHTECFLFVPLSHINRFINSATKQSDPAHKFLQWRGITNNIDSIESFAECVEKSFRGVNRYCYKFELKHNQNRYYLYFITSHIFGAQKFLEARDAILVYEISQGVISSDEAKRVYDKEMELRFEPKLKEFLKTKRDNLDIYSFSIESGFLPRITNSILKKLEKVAQLDIRDIGPPTGKTRRKGAFYIYKDVGLKIEVTWNGN
ncbi:hypothetical protein RsTz2092_05730 [Deferribacterales bacterium RsTz2092]|nr:hypothetical protein AGMMS49941_05850 [Deferribacterales bacterium]